jgi:hypothetical protein
MTEPRVILKVGKQLSLVFFPEKKRLCIFVQWESANNVQKVSASRLVVLRKFTKDDTEEIVLALLGFAGYDTGKRVSPYYSRKGIAVGRGPRGNVSLSLFREKSFDFDRLRLRLKPSQVAEVCRGIAPALGWELTE